MKVVAELMVYLELIYTRLNNGKSEKFYGTKDA